MKRRDFLKSIGGLIGGLSLFGKGKAKAVVKKPAAIDMAELRKQNPLYRISCGKTCLIDSNFNAIDVSLLKLCEEPNRHRWFEDEMFTQGLIFGARKKGYTTEKVVYEDLGVKEMGCYKCVRTGIKIYGRRGNMPLRTEIPVENKQGVLIGFVKES